MYTKKTIFMTGKFVQIKSAAKNTSTPVRHTCASSFSFHYFSSATVLTVPLWPDEFPPYANSKEMG